MKVESGEQELREQLLANNEEFRRLAAEHKSYADQLEKLNDLPHLNDDERLQEITLKKKKLMLKEQMYIIVQKYRREVESRS